VRWVGSGQYEYVILIRTNVILYVQIIFFVTYKVNVILLKENTILLHFDLKILHFSSKILYFNFPYKKGELVNIIY